MRRILLAAFSFRSADRGARCEAQATCALRDASRIRRARRCASVRSTTGPASISAATSGGWIGRRPKSDLVPAASVRERDQQPHRRDRGVQIGYNWQNSPSVFGVVSRFSDQQPDRAAFLPDLSGRSVRRRDKRDYEPASFRGSATVRGGLGYAQDWLDGLSSTGGYAYDRVSTPTRPRPRARSTRQRQRQRFRSDGRWAAASKCVLDRNWKRQGRISLHGLRQPQR